MNHRSGYRGVVFDLDGTLVDSYEALARSVNFARTQTGYGPLDEETIKSFVGDGLEKLLERAFDDCPVPTLFAGDMLIDIEAARNAGLHVAVIPTGSTDAAVLREAHADYFLEKFSDISAIVRARGSAP